LLRELEKYPLDYIIQGQHYVEDEIDGFYAGSWTCSEERLKAYVDYTIEGMKTGRFTYLAHPDLINYMGPDDVYCRHMRRIVETAVDMDLPLEINLYGFADCRWYPSDRFFKMASEYHPRFVIGCDAHAPWFIRQPERVEGFNDFLRENGIECGDNIIEIQEI
jgi:histidinol-phosphatase (PHP family)